MQQLAMALRELGALEEALHLLTEVLAQARALQLNTSLPETLQELATTLALLGRYSEVQVALSEAIELWTELGNPIRNALALTLQAQVLLETGAPEEARRSAQQVVSLLSAEREPRSVALALDLVAWLALMPEEAAQLVGAADTLFEQIHYPRRPTQQPKTNELRQRLLKTLGSDGLHESLVRGSALSIREALALASRCLLLPSDKKIFR